MEEIVGTYKATRYRDPNGQFWVGFLEDDTTLTGTMDTPDDPLPEYGKTYRFFGAWKNSPKYGRQFKAVVWTEHEPHAREAVCKYLERHLKGTGIGAVKCVKLWDAYGSEAIRTVRERPLEVAKLLGIKDDQAIEAGNRLDVHKKTENTLIDLMGLLQGHGFPVAMMRDAMNKWGPQSPSIIRHDPFRLMVHRMKGAGFSRCDKLYSQLGLPQERLKRQTLCAWNYLQSGGSGDTWLTYDNVAEGIQRLIGGVATQPKKAVALGVRSGWLASREEGGTRWIGEGRRARNEARVVKEIARLNSSRLAWPAVLSSSLSDHQATELDSATQTPVGVLSGTPGTGKTFTAAALIKSCLSKYSDGEIFVVAPTGKAAVRLTDSISRAGLDLKATTIHRALCPDSNGHGTGDWGFRYNSSNPLPARVVIVDETSMVDTDLMASLLSSLKTGTLVLLIGDPYQLPPVGHGAPLRDIIAAGVSHGKLREIRRNSGLIVDACRSIRTGKRIPSCDRCDDEGNNLRFVPASSPTAVLRFIKGIFDAVCAKGSRDPVEDIQVLVGMNSNGDLSRSKLNPLVQNILNANGKQARGNRFRVNDKCICTNNGMYPTAYKTTEFLANGEMGRIVEVAPTHYIAKFPDVGDGVREVRIPMKTQWDESFQLAYAITTHKSQGSEWPVVIIIADESAHRVCSREWWYTAVSRAKDRCLILGRISTVDRQCKRISLEQRKTFLAEDLKERLSGTESRACHEAHQEANQRENQESSISPHSPSFATRESNTLSSSPA